MQYVIFKLEVAGAQAQIQATLGSNKASPSVWIEDKQLSKGFSRHPPFKHTFMYDVGCGYAEYAQWLNISEAAKLRYLQGAKSMKS